MLFEHSEKRAISKYRMDAAIHGIKLDDESTEESTPKAPKQKRGVSGDPDSYNHLSDEERKELTRKMMGKHKMWAEVDKPLGGKEPIDKR